MKPSQIQITQHTWQQVLALRNVQAGEAWRRLRTLKTGAAVAAMVALAGTAQAALVNRGGGMIYDTTRNITWLANMNVNGLMNWSAATAWADNLVYGGFSDWRLPTLNPADTTCSDNFNPGGGFPNQFFGTGCTGGELSGLFVTDLGNKAGESVLNQVGDTAEQIAHLALFSNVQSFAYWSGTEYAPNPDLAWRFRTNVGVQTFDGLSLELYAVAVRPGDVTASVPEPTGLVLAMTGLGLLMVFSAGLPRSSRRIRQADLQNTQPVR